MAAPLALTTPADLPRLLTRVADESRRLRESPRESRVGCEVDPAKIRRLLARRYDFAAPMAADALIADVARMLGDWSVDVTHPRYFGLFNPSVRPISVAADALVALYNPQLAAWSHAPAANEIERHLVGWFAARIGFDPAEAEGHFTSGGQEANHTAVIAALVHRFPELPDHGLRSLPGQPVIYLSEEGHRSLEKVAVATGLGRAALRTIPTGDDFRLDPSALERAIAEDRRAGQLPLLVVATAGTTASGSVDPLPELAAIARREELWLHVDAAWGGGALLSRTQRHLLAGVEQADSVTWDAHKWLSVPMGAGMVFCRHPGVFDRAFSSAAGYMPGHRQGTVEPHASSLQWSRRFIGLKVFMALAEAGAEGIEQLIDHQTAMGELLRERLRAAGFEVVHDAPLPVVCFTHRRLEGGADTPGRLAKRVAQAGKVWLSAVTLPRVGQTLRACITSYRTEPEDLDTLVAEVLRELR